MALYSSRSIYLCPFRFLVFKKMQSYLCSAHHPNKDDSSVLDDFTSQLMQRKSSKWERQKTQAQKNVRSSIKTAITDIARNNTSINIKQLEINSINELFQTAIDYDDTLTIIDLTKQCIMHDKVPPLVTLLHALSVCSREGEKDIIIEVSQLCEKIRPEILQENSNFEHYIAEAIWIRGDIVKSLKLFERIYKENCYLRRSIRSILKNLIIDSVSNNSEALIVNLLQFSDMLVKEHNDYFTLGCIWQACILSEWFTDQEIALKLLDKYEPLCNVIMNKIPFVVKISLKNHRTEVVYRLTEALLKFKMENEISQVLLALIDYWIQQGDFRQCKEIILWAIENKIDIPAVFNNQSLMKLMVKDVVPKDKPETRSVTDYKF